MSERTWHERHIDAGYHEQVWGPTPTAQTPIIGSYVGIKGRLEVRFKADGITGPELEIEWADGSAVTVVDEATAAQYLMSEHAQRA